MHTEVLSLCSEDTDYFGSARGGVQLKWQLLEMATFGIQLMAPRVCKEIIVALRYKLRMFGMTIDGTAT